MTPEDVKDLAVPQPVSPWLGFVVPRDVQQRPAAPPWPGEQLPKAA